MRTRAGVEPTAVPPRNSPSPAGKATPAPLGVEEVLALLREDRLCEFQKRDVPTLVLLDALLLQARSPVLTSILGPQGPMRGEPDFRASGEAELFFTALLYAGMIEGQFASGSLARAGGAGGPAVDYAHADRLLEELEARDAENGAYPMFRLAIAARSGQPVERQRAIALRMLRRKRFNTFTKAVFDELSSLFRINPSYYLTSIHVVTQLPIPDYPRANLINTLLAAEPREVHLEAVRFGLMLTDLPHAIVVEKAIGMGIVRESWPKARFPPDQLPDLRKKILPPRNAGEDSKFMEALGKLSGARCDRRPMDEYFSRHREEALPF